MTAVLIFLSLLCLLFLKHLLSHTCSGLKVIIKILFLTTVLDTKWPGVWGTHIGNVPRALRGSSSAGGHWEPSPLHSTSQGLETVVFSVSFHSDHGPVSYRRAFSPILQVRTRRWEEMKTMQSEGQGRTSNQHLLNLGSTLLNLNKMLLLTI